MAPRKRISKAARAGGLSLASLAAMVWVAMVANLSQLGPVGLDGQATIQLLGAFELIALFALLTALTILAAAAGEMTRGANWPPLSCCRSLLRRAGVRSRRSRARRRPSGAGRSSRPP